MGDKTTKKRNNLQYCPHCDQWKNRKNMFHVGINAVCIKCEHLSTDRDNESYMDSDEGGLS